MIRPKEGRGTYCFLGCASIGPGTVIRERFDYVTCISEYRKGQMLLNLLKVRYGDGPVFMDAASLINAYEVTGDVSRRAQEAKAGCGDQIASLGVAHK